MPIYEYECRNEKCGKEVTLVRKVEDRDKTFKCICGSIPKRKVSQTGQPKFEGSDWTPKFHE